MTTYEVDVSSSPVTVRNSAGRIVAEGMGLEIKSARVELIEPGLLAVHSSMISDEKRNNVVILHGTGSTGQRQGLSL